MDKNLFMFSRSTTSKYLLALKIINVIESLTSNQQSIIETELQQIFDIEDFENLKDKDFLMSLKTFELVEILDFLENTGFVRESLNEARKKKKKKSKIKPGRSPKFRKVMGEFGKGELVPFHAKKALKSKEKGGKPEEYKQALAIAYSEAGLTQESLNEELRRDTIIDNLMDQLQYLDLNWEQADFAIGSAEMSGYLDEIIFNIQQGEQSTAEGAEQIRNTAFGKNESKKVCKAKLVSEVLNENFYNNLGKSNSYYRVIEPFEIWIESGWKQTGAYSGTSPISERTYKSVTAEVGDIIENLHGGLFYKGKASNEKRVRVKAAPPSDRSPFEKGRDYEKFPLEKLERYYPK